VTSTPDLDLSPTLIDRAAGVLLTQAVGDALGVPYEFASPPADEPEMIGGGLGPYEPGEWSDDTQMAICIARVAATGADLTSSTAVDAVAAAFEGWLNGGASDVGTQTRAVLRAAAGATGPAGIRLTTAAREYTASHPRSAGNGALMRTSIVGLTRLHDRDHTAASARAVAAITHADRLAIDSCVLWSDAVRRAVVDGRLDLTSGLDLIDADGRDQWASWIDEATGADPARFCRTGSPSPHSRPRGPRSRRPTPASEMGATGVLATQRPTFAAHCPPPCTPGTTPTPSRRSPAGCWGRGTERPPHPTRGAAWSTAGRA